MRDDDLARLAEKIAMAWAGGDSRAITQKQAVVASVFMTLREINDRRQPQTSGDAQSKAADQRSGRDTSVRLICCPECESIMRDAGALARHRRFCVMGMRKVHLGEG